MNALCKPTLCSDNGNTKCNFLPEASIPSDKGINENDYEEELIPF